MIIETSNALGTILQQSVMELDVPSPCFGELRHGGEIVNEYEVDNISHRLPILESDAGTFIDSAYF